MNPLHTVLLAEDHALLRAGLKSLIDAQAGLRVCGEAAHGMEVVHACGHLHPDLILMDLSMPGRNGLSTLHEIHRRWPQIRILVLSAHRDPGVVRDALRAGAHGYVVKDVTAEELLLGMRSVLAGEPYVSADVAGTVIEGFLQRHATPDRQPGAVVLTARETEVLGLVASGRTSRQIAQHLQVSIKTVETHRMNMMRKLDLHKASEVTAYAMTHGLMPERKPPASESAGPATGACRAPLKDPSEGPLIPSCFVPSRVTP